MTENDNKQLIILALGIAGIVIGFFAYLVYIKSKENQPTIQPLYNSNYNEKIYSNLENIQSQLQNQQFQISNIGNDKVSNEQIYNLLQNQQYQIDYMMDKMTNNQSTTKFNSDNIRNLEIPKSKLMKAGDVSSIRSTSYDKVRQMKYGML